MNNISHISGHLLKQFNTVKHKRISVAVSSGTFFCHKRTKENKISDFSERDAACNRHFA
jgi:hypothetical protein